MLFVKCYRDFEDLSQGGQLHALFVQQLEEDLRVVHEWADEVQEYSFSDFHTDVLQCGYIAILECAEDAKELEALGVSGGLDGLVPETEEWYQFNQTEWVRLVVIYNDSYSMIFWMSAGIYQGRYQVLKILVEGC